MSRSEFESIVNIVALTPGLVVRHTVLGAVPRDLCAGAATVVDVFISGRAII